MTNDQNRQPNNFYKISGTSYLGSYISLTTELHEIELAFSHNSRNGNEVWVLTTPSPRTGVMFPIGTATLMQPEAEGEGPYFLGRIEDPSGLNIPFKIAPQNPEEPEGPWAIRYNPPMTANTGAQGQQRAQRQGFGAQRSTRLGGSMGTGGFPRSTLGGSTGHRLNGAVPNGYAGERGARDDDSPF